MNKLPDSRLLRQRLDMFLNFPRGGLEVCGAVYPLAANEPSPEPRPQLPPLPDLLDSRPRKSRR